MLYEKYFRLLKEEAKIFEKAGEIRKIIEERARKIFRDPKVYIIGSFKEKKHKFSSDLDILIVSKDIPKKIKFEWYSKIVKELLGDLDFEKINIHLVNEEEFKKLKKLYFKNE